MSTKSCISSVPVDLYILLKGELTTKGQQFGSISDLLCQKVIWLLAISAKPMFQGVAVPLQNIAQSNFMKHLQRHHAKKQDEFNQTKEEDNSMKQLNL